MTTIELRTEAMLDSWEQVERLVYDTVHKFQRTYGGNFEDLFGEAQIAFCNAFDDYRAAQGTWAAAVKHYVWFTLLTTLRKDLKRKKNRAITYTDEDPSIYARKKHTFDVKEFVETLSQDAKTVVKLCLETPPELAVVIAKRGGTALNTRSAVREFLIASGWDRVRFRKAFEEVRANL